MNEDLMRIAQRTYTQVSLSLIVLLNLIGAPLFMVRLLVVLVVVNMFIDWMLGLHKSKERTEDKKPE